MHISQMGSVGNENNKRHIARQDYKVSLNGSHYCCAMCIMKSYI